MAEQKWCGQTQPHNSHRWSDASQHIHFYADCAGYSGKAPKLIDDPSRIDVMCWVWAEFSDGKITDKELLEGSMHQTVDGIGVQPRGENWVIKINRKKGFVTNVKAQIIHDFDGYTFTATMSINKPVWRFDTVIVTPDVRISCA